MFTKKRIHRGLDLRGAHRRNGQQPRPARISLTITAGTLNFDGGAPAIGNFSGVTLNGTPQLTSLTVDPFTVVDATGSGDGWNVLLTVPDLDDGGGHTIAASNISMTAPVVTAAATADITGVVGHASAGGFNAGEKIVTASAAQRRGHLPRGAPDPQADDPGHDASPATYTSAATIATVDGP